jgi:hypothetical protein
MMVSATLITRLAALLTMTHEYKQKKHTQAAALLLLLHSSAATSTATRDACA